MKKFFYFILFTFLFMFGQNVVYALEDGVYSIKSAMNDNMVIDVYMGWTKNEANVQLFTNNSGANQLWDVKSLGGGYYTIKSIANTSFSLDAYGAKPKAGANIQLYKYNGGDNQKWLIKEDGNGYYYIICKYNNLYLDVYYSLAKNGTNIQLWNKNGGKNQKWKFEKKQTISNGIYTIKSALNNNLVVQSRSGISSNATNVQLEQSNNKDYQKWEVKYLGNGYYSIKMALNTGVSLDVYGAYKNPGTNTEVYQNNSKDNQKWIIKDAGGGYYYIISKCNNLALDVYYGTAKAGTNIQMFTQNGGNNQKWKFEKVSMEKNTQPITKGTYIIKSALSNQMVADVYGAKANDGTNVELFTQNGGNNQKWIVEPLSDGYYTITTGMSDNMSLDVHNSGKNPGTNAEIYRKNGGDNQKWIIKDAGGGYYYIISKCNNLYLDVYYGLAKNGSNMQLWTYSGGNNQKFSFIKTDINVDNSKEYNGKKFSFTSLLNTNQAIDIDHSITLNNQNTLFYQNGNKKNQLWYAEYVGDGYFAIKSVLNKKVALTIKNDSKNENAEIVVYSYNGKDNQKWRIKNQGNNNVSFVSKSTEFYITANNNAANNTKLVLKKENNNDSQKFKKAEYKGDVIYRGFDVSHHNNIDWDAVAKNESIDFVIIRAGYGKDWFEDGTGNNGDQMDRNYIYNVRSCEERNIPYAVYLYSYATNLDEIAYESKTTVEGKSVNEAQHMLNLLNKVKNINNQYEYKPTLGTQVFLDMEDNSTIGNKETAKKRLTEMADAFCTKIENNKYNCGIYANKVWFENYLNVNELAKEFTLWYARKPWDREDNTRPSVLPTFTDAENNLTKYLNKNLYTYWQFTSWGYFNGTKGGNVDLDLGLNIFDK